MAGHTSAALLMPIEADMLGATDTDIVVHCATDAPPHHRTIMQQRVLQL